MEKSPDAFRTISEVAEELDLPQHVLRFWETKFPQIRPLKRGGGRRYYRPDDVELLRGIRHLLYGEGYTIRGVQRILKEEGPRYVQAILRDAMGGEGGSGEGRDLAVDSGSSGTARRPSAGGEGKTSSLSGFFGLLPGRRATTPDEAPRAEPQPEPDRASVRRPARRRPSEDEPSFLDMPLLPDFDPPRPEFSRHEPPRHELSRHVEPRRDPPRPFVPGHVEPRILPDDDGPVFPFRVGGEPEPLPPIMPRRAERPEPFIAPAAEPASRLTAFRPLDAAEDGLSEDEARQLRESLAELQECYRILMEARRGGV